MTRESKANARTVSRMVEEYRADMVADCAEWCEEYGDTLDAIAEWTTGDCWDDLAEMLDGFTFDEIIHGLAYAVARTW